MVANFTEVRYSYVNKNSANNNAENMFIGNITRKSKLWRKEGRKEGRKERKVEGGG
jgi:translation elongation factor EF-4